MSKFEGNLNDFDIEYYEKQYPDLQNIVKNMDIQNKSAFLLDHFIKHGYREGRSYRMRPHTSTNSIVNIKKINDETQISNKFDESDNDSDSETDDNNSKKYNIYKKIRAFRKLCENEKGGPRDKHYNDTTNVNPKPNNDFIARAGPSPIINPSSAYYANGSSSISRITQIPQSSLQSNNKYLPATHSVSGRILSESSQRTLNLQKQKNTAILTDRKSFV